MRTRKYSFSFISFIFLFHIILVPAAGAVNKIMPLGDSITNGNSSGAVPDNSAYYVSYRKALWDKLLAAGYDIDFVGSLNSGSAIFGALEPADHEGHPGWTDDQIVNGRPAETEKGNLAIWLDEEQPEIVLLHIGTNGLDPSPDDVEAILDKIDAFSPNVWVVMARIINRSCITDLPSSCPESVTTMNFNINVANMAQSRILSGDKIIIVAMENDAVIDYHLTTDNPPGDMWDNLHPFDTGYAKMADLWFTGLMSILPLADAGPDQSVDAFGTVTLDGSGSTDPKIGNGNNLSYQWVQTAGTPVVLFDDTAVQPTFDAPGVGANGEVLSFMLTVTDDDDLISTDTVEINVIPFAEIIGTWSDGIWYRDVAESRWAQMTTSVTDGDIAAGDFTGDGIADVASIWPNGLFYQDGATLDWSKKVGSAPNRVTAGDVTGDGRPEIIGTWIGTGTDNDGIWYWDVAESSWTQMTTSVTDGDIAAGDFTGDGIADVASIWPSGLYYQDGATLDWSKKVGSAPNRVTAGDVTGDGRPEIIGTWIGTGTDNDGIWYWDVAESSWTQMTTSVTDGDIAAGDFTGDGIADVASIWPSGLYYQDGATLDWSKKVGSAPNRVTAGDVTGQ